MDETNELYNGWDYVTHGPIFEILDQEKNNLRIGISYGGLLMGLEGKKSHLNVN